MFIINNILPYMLTDILNIRHYSRVNNIILIYLWLINFSFIPTIILYIKLFMFILLLINLINFIISLIIFLMFIFQGLFLRCFDMILL